MPDLPGLAAAGPMTHIELLDLDRLPEHLVVMGGGFVGLELAQAMRRFGSRVTVIERGPQLAGGEDPDVAVAVLELFRDEGIDVLLRTRVRGAEGKSGREVRVLTDRPDGEGAVTGTDLLAAAGRTPNTAGIGLEQAGIELTGAGYIKVDEHLATTADQVWAMGDCAGSPQFTHVAFDDFRVVLDHLYGGTRATTGRLVPFCMFLDPELARVGCNETEARSLGLGYRLLTLPMAAVLRTRTLSEPRGFLKMLIAADSDEILGFTAFGAEATELLAAVQAAMVARIPTQRCARHLHPPDDGRRAHLPAQEHTRPGLTAQRGGRPRTRILTRWRRCSRGPRWTCRAARRWPAGSAWRRWPPGRRRARSPGPCPRSATATDG